MYIMYMHVHVIWQQRCDKAMHYNMYMYDGNKQNRGKIKALQASDKVSSHSNELANATRRLIGKRHKFATVYPVIYCRKLDVIS